MIFISPERRMRLSISDQ